MGEKRSKGPIVLVVILIIVVFALSGYIYYTDYYNPNTTLITKTKVVKSESNVTSQIANALAKQTYEDNSNIWGKFNSTVDSTNPKRKQISDYDEIMNKYYTKKGIKDFESVNSNILTKDGTNAYMNSTIIDINCNINSLEFTVVDYNKKEINYKATEKKICDDGDDTKTKDVKTTISEIKLILKNNTWKIDSLEVGSSN